MNKRLGSYIAGGLMTLATATQGFAGNDIKTDTPYTGPDRVNLTSGYHVGKTRGTNTIDKIIVHVTDSEGKSAENWFHDHKAPRGSQVSAHYIIEKDGDIVQIVPENKTAYHCRGKNSDSIGIEFVGKLPNTKKGTLTKEQLESAYSIIPHLQNKYHIKDKAVQGHRDFSSKECPGKTNMEYLRHIVDNTEPNF
jgi:N-acetyl-anhydromuramyl-L-alanine amidase AmpD